MRLRSQSRFEPSSTLLPRCAVYAAAMSMRRHVITSALAAAILTPPIVTGCGKDSGKEPESSEQAPKPADKTPAPQQPATPADPARELGRKLNHFIKCTNTLSGKLYYWRQRYHLWANTDANKPPTLKDRGNIGVDAIDAKVCFDALASVPAKPDTPKLTAAGKQYEAQVRSLVPVLNELHTYYEKQRHRLDNMKLGAERHPKVVNGFAAFAAADRALRTEVARIADELQAGRLAKLKAKGENFWYYRALVLHRAKQVVREVARLRTPAELDLKAFDTRRPTLLAAHKALAGTLDSNEAKSWRQTKRFTDKLQAFLDQLDFLRAWATKTMKPQGSEAFLIKHNKLDYIRGYPASVVRAYNHMIDVMN